MIIGTPDTDAMVTRTTALDRLIRSAINKGIDTVLNLGAGLDTHPYRMSLPENLQWIEVDFPSTVNYKNEILKEESPVCNLRHIAADLSDKHQRLSLFKQLGSETKRALIITEGVIGYLSNEDAEGLAYDIFNIFTFCYWLMDYSQGRMRKNRMSKKVNKKLKHSHWIFNESDPIQFFGKTGWKLEENIYVLDEADRIGRSVPLKFPYSIAMKLFPKTIRGLGNKTYGYALLMR